MDDQLFSLVMEHSPNLVFLKDERSVILYANRAFLEVYQPEKRGTIVGTTTIEDFSPQEAALWLSEDRRAFDVGKTEMVEEIVDHAGRKRVFLTRKIAFASTVGEPRLLGISTDITELADRERHLVEAYKRLEQFSAFVAHDLRSPIASFVSALDLVRLDKETTLGPKADGYLTMMRACANGLATQVTSMLAAAKAEHGDGLFTRETDLNLLLEDVRFNLSAFMDRTGATLHASRLPRLDVEPHLFRQLLQNLVENAIRHRSDRPPVVIIRHEETEIDDLISVEDNGQGISRDDMQRVFEAFEQGGDAKGGTGIGLALCRRVAGLHQGSITIDPAYEAGCRVVLKLPKMRRGVVVDRAA